MKTRQILAGLLAVVLLAGGSVSAASDNNPKAAKTAPAKAVAYKVDTQKSILNWKGEKVTGKHNGTVKFSDGTLNVDGKKLVGGQFTFDMNSINNLDLTDKTYNDKLVGHLKSEDFFNTAKFPTSTFKITKVTPKGGDNYDITGDMTIKGITNAVSFPAVVKMSGNTIEATGKAKIDRTKYDIRYGSKSFFESIGDKAIYDDFDIDLKLVATK